jgi:hypothetical protein
MNGPGGPDGAVTTAIGAPVTAVFAQCSSQADPPDTTPPCNGNGPASIPDLNLRWR